MAVNGVTADQNGVPVLSTLLGKGDGSFQPQVEEPASPGVGDFAVADFNGDGMMDLATLDGSLATVFLGTTAALSPYIVNFGDQSAGTTSQPQAVTLTNTGSSTIAISNVTVKGDFAQTNNCGSSLAAGATCTFNITFTPPTFGTDTGTMTVIDSALGSPQTIALSGTGEAPGASLSPASLSFGNQLVATTSQSQAVTLTNTGNQPLTITSIRWSGVAFHKAGGGCFVSLPPGGHCGFQVDFAPQGVGAFKGSVTFTDNAAGSPQTATLTGTGIAFKLSTTSLDFGDVPVGQTSAPQTVTVTNMAQAAENISIRLKGTGAPEFAETNTCGTSLGGGASCSISATFSPTVAGRISPTLEINGGGALQGVSLIGTGTR